ncbi:hypothetical protein [Salsipaludibacter albus]|uniref:hypothetical protein n=1 Tax=Salsipaludibacter albus TaxID=2849650 RepID=UPI001EE4C1E5|nr:hypothetical protein [Salsipaludibacter albus]MBY5162024.1 hypothetical protein [Salsipaludibacter albus]
MIDPPIVDWEDVAFDRAAAREAARACRRLARLLDRVATWHHGSTSALLDTWQGNLAVLFANEDRILVEHMAVAADDLLRCASGLDEAAEAAGEEQARRERGREDWWAWDARRHDARRVAG